MNPWQMAQQIKHELQTITWPGGSGGLVFGSSGVYCHAGPLAEDQYPTAFPFALVTIDAGAPDPDDPDLIEQQFTVVHASRSRGSTMGEHAVIGGPRADLGNSAGAGSPEVGERVRAALQAMTRYDGAAMIVSGTGVTATQQVQGRNHIAFETHTFTAQCTSQEHYTAPQGIQRNGDTWSWDPTSAQQRFDFVHFRLGYVVGDTPVASPSDAGWVNLNTTTYGMALGAPEGGRVYQVFAGYDPRGTGAAAYYSAAEGELPSVVMAGRRDDIVMRPRLDRSQNPTNSKGRTKEARQLQLMEQGQRSLRNRLLVARAARRIQKRRIQAARARKLARLGAKARRGFSVAGRGVGRAVSRTPWGLVIAGLAVAGAVVTKIATGRSFEQLGQDLRQRLYGDLDLEAQAASNARRQVTSNNMLMRQLARDGRTGLAKEAFEFIRREELRRLRGRRVLERAFTVNSTADNFIETRVAAVRRAILRAFGEDSEVVDAARRFKTAFRNSYKTNVLEVSR